MSVRAPAAPLRRLALAGILVLIAAGCSGLPPLIDAARDGDDSHVQFLLSEGAFVDQPGPHDSTALYFAAHEGHTSTVALLIAAGADVNARTAQNSSALEVAVFGQQTKIVELLLAAGADVNVQSAQYGSTPLMLAVQGDPKIVEMLIDNGADLELKNHAGQWALFSAARDSGAEIVEMLIAAGAEVDATTPQAGLSALHAAAWKGNLPTARLLLGSGADPRLAAVNGATPLDFAREEGHASLVELLESATED